MFKTYKVDLIVSFSLSIVIFLIFFFSIDSFLISSSIGLGMLILLIGNAITSRQFGLKRHIKILNSNSFEELRNLGFRIVNKNKYHGLYGNYRGYIFDIFYDWETLTQGGTGRAIIFNIYFNSPLNSKSELDEKKIHEIDNRNKAGYFSTRKYKLLWRDGNLILRYSVGIFNPSSEKIKSIINKACDILVKEELKPMTESDLKLKRDKFYFNNIPEIELYYKE